MTPRMAEIIAAMVAAKLDADAGRPPESRGRIRAPQTPHADGPARRITGGPR